jgi:putative endonuclease
MTNRWNTVLYTGVTSGLKGRAWEHRNGQGCSFTSRYRCTKLVYYEVRGTMEDAIAREKQIKKMSRKKKIALIEAMNPDWRDLYPEI